MIAIDCVLRRRSSAAFARSIPLIWIRGGDEPEVECNSGGPRSRRKELRLQATILGEGEGPLSCPKVRVAALEFGDREPVPFVRDLLAGLGFASPEAARVELVDLAGPCICHTSRGIAAVSVDEAPPEIVLEHALVLGLSTPSLFDPARPIVWTRASLTRRLVLYEVGGFYA